MEIIELNKEIRAGIKRNLYIFVGTEFLGCDGLHINKIQELTQLPKIRVDSVSSINSVLGSTGLLSEGALYIVPDDTALLSNEVAMRNLPTLVGNSCLILTYNCLDRRTKFYNTLSDYITQFNPLSETVLINKIKDVLPLSTEFCKELILICESDLLTIYNELDKIVAYSQTENKAPNNAFTELSNLGVIVGRGTYKNDKLGLILANALIYKRGVEAFNLVRQVTPDYVIGILSIAAAIFRNHYLVKKSIEEYGNRGYSTISKKAGLSFYITKSIIDKPSPFTADGLYNAMQVLYKTIKDVKNGCIGIDAALPYAIMKILTG